MSWVLRPFGNQKGVALIMAMAAMTVLLFLAMEVSYDTHVEFLISHQQIERQKAYYAAKAGLELSLLRVFIYQKVIAQFGEQLGENKSLLDPIWQLPFSWPPLLPDEMSGIDRENIQAAVAASQMQAQYLATIEIESGKIDLSGLTRFAEEGEALQEITRQQLRNIFQSELANNEEFNRNYASFDFERLINHLTDWVNVGDESLNGGNKKNFYQDIRSDFIPPGRPFKTMSELNMVADMDDELFALLRRHTTIFGSRGININYANLDTLMALHPLIDEEAAQAIINRRNEPNLGGPFVNFADFDAFLQSLGIRLDWDSGPTLPLLFSAPLNFRITSTGQSANVSREIVAITYDFNNMTEDSVANWSQEITEEAGGTPPATQTGSQEQAGRKEAPYQAPTGRPRIVSWWER